jgi:hypothetical protein
MECKQLLKYGMCILIAVMIFLPGLTFGQKKNEKNKKPVHVPMKSEHWKFQPDKIEFVNYKTRESVKSQRGGGIIIAKDMVFSDGTIEFDVEPLEASTAPFVTMYFRFQDEKENECFYMRVGREENQKRNDAVQYAPFIKGVNLWDMLPHFQGPAAVNNKDWNHIKLVVSGRQMIAYVNDMSKPALRIPYLESNSKQGSIAFEGFAAFANLVVKHGEAVGLSSTAGVDLTDHDANYIRNWLVSQPKSLEPGRELHQGDLPTHETGFEPIVAERNGLINVTRKYGVGDRQYVWLKVKIRSTANVFRKMSLGFSDEVWIFLNQQMVYVDKNLYLQGMRKTPNGRCSVENSTLTLQLNAGDNELVIGVANDFYGWGIIARLETVEDLEIVSGM